MLMWHTDPFELKTRFPVPRLPMEAAMTLIPARQYRTARRYCATGRLRRVCDMDQLHASLQAVDMQKYTRTIDGHRLLSFRDREHDSLLITSDRQLEVLSSAERIHADAGVQLFTIHAIRGKQVSISYRSFLSSPMATYSVCISNQHERS